MRILAKFREILQKTRKKEEILQNNAINLEIVDIESIPEEVAVEPNPNMFYRHKRIRIPLSHYIKQALRWLNLKNEFGEELINQEDDINLIFSHWNKSLILWFFNIFLTGILIYLAILPFYSVNFILVPFTIFSFGLLYYILIKTLREIKQAVGGKHG